MKTMSPQEFRNWVKSGRFADVQSNIAFLDNCMVWLEIDCGLTYSVGDDLLGQAIYNANEDTRTVEGQLEVVDNLIRMMKELNEKS